MRSRNLIAFASALAMIGSLAAAVPASAATSSTTVTASVAAQVRSANADWNTMNAGGTKFVPDENGNNNIETTGYNSRTEANTYFSAFYYFDASDEIPEGATITSASIDIYQGETKFSGRNFAVASVAIPSDLTSTSSVWESVSAVMSPDNAASTTVNATMVELHDEAANRTMRADVTSLIDTGADEFAFTSYNINREDGNRQLSGTATLTITYEYDDEPAPVSPTVSILDGSVVTANGTGDHTSEVATGFIAEVVTADVAATKMGVTIGENDEREPQNITTLTNATAYFKVIVQNVSETNPDNIHVYVQ